MVTLYYPIYYIILTSLVVYNHIINNLKEFLNPQTIVHIILLFPYENKF